MRRLLFIALIFAASLSAQAIRFDSASYTTNAGCVAGKLCPVLAIPGSSISVCIPPLCASRATTYTSATAGSTCNTLAQLTPATGGACLATSDNQGNFGFWILPGSYNYYITLPSSAGGTVYGPYPISIHGDSGGYTYDANYTTLALACAAAGSGTLAVSVSWNSTPTQTLSCNLLFFGGGIIRVGANQTITLPLTKSITSPPEQQVFDSSASGAIITFSGVPPAGTTNIPNGTYTVSTTVSVSTAHAKIACQPGATIKAGADNIIVFDISQSDVTFSGCHFDGAGHVGVRFMAQDGASANNFTSIKSTCTGTIYGGSADAACVYGAGTSTGLTVLQTVCTSMGGCLKYFNTDGVTVDDMLCNNIDSHDNCVAGTIPYGTFTNGATAYVNNVRGTTLGRFGVELFNFGYRSVVVSNTNFTDISADCISLALSRRPSSLPSQIISAIAKDNTCNGNSSASTSYGIEAQATSGLQIVGNVINGPFITGIKWNGPGAVISQNFITGGSGPGMETNPGGVENYTNDCVIENNVTVNNKTAGILFNTDASGCVVKNNHDSRAPGYWPGDSSQIYSAFFAPDTAGKPMLTEGNFASVLAPVNAYALPGTMLWACMRTSNTNSAASPATFRDNVCENSNVTSFGQRFYGGTDAWYANIILAGQKYTNLTTPAAFTEYSSAALIKYSNNQALAGLGGSPYTDFTIGNAIFSGTVTAIAFTATGGISTTPTCITGVALDGTGGVNCSSGVTGTPYSGYVLLAASGTPSATPGAVVFTLTFAAGAFSATPKCVWSNADARTYAVYYNLASTSTSGIWGLAGSALVAGSNYRLTYNCPVN